MIISNMVGAWRNREENGSVALPAEPAGASPLDEVYLDAIAGGAADSIDFLTFVCTSSVPHTWACPVSRTCA